MRKVLFLFGQLGDDDVEWLRRNGQPCVYQPADVLIEQGRPLTSIFIILSGMVTVAVDGTVLTHLGAGEIVGEMSFVDARPPSATVTAETAVLALVLARKAMSNHLAANALFAARFYRAIALFLSDRLRAMEPRRALADSATTENVGLLDHNVLEDMSDAGLRFDRLVQATIQSRGYGP